MTDHDIKSVDRGSDNRIISPDWLKADRSLKPYYRFKPQTHNPRSRKRLVSVEFTDEHFGGFMDSEADESVRCACGWIATYNGSSELDNFFLCCHCRREYAKAHWERPKWSIIGERLENN